MDTPEVSNATNSQVVDLADAISVSSVSTAAALRGSLKGFAALAVAASCAYLAEMAIFYAWLNWAWGLGFARYNVSALWANLAAILIVAAWLGQRAIEPPRGASSPELWRGM